ncbi:hypothetical protein DPMN_063074 [Dreissena polymorpha]|uniref:Uncharacterized protein n=1 Tax=Dreissena polymorpha TaxID=45954 RepID=A0A9D4CAV1_DREPO|nr:hypothetical protein DPMN_063074 [Dreissena polymorpha]
MSCVESVRDTYYNYAYAQAEMVADLRRQLYGEVVNIVTDDDDEIDDVIDAIDDVNDETTGASNVIRTRSRREKVCKVADDV